MPKSGVWLMPYDNYVLHRKVTDFSCAMNLQLQLIETRDFYFDNYGLILYSNDFFLWYEV